MTCPTIVLRLIALTLLSTQCTSHTGVPADTERPQPVEDQRGNCSNDLAAPVNMQLPSKTIEAEGVAFQVRASWIEEEQSRFLRVWVRAKAVDGACHGIVDEPLRYSALYRNGSAGIISRSSRSPCVYPVIWLDDTHEAVLHIDVASTEHFGGMLREVTVGVFEVESAKAGMTYSPDLVRIAVHDHAQTPTIHALPQSNKLERGWYLRDRQPRCGAASPVGKPVAAP